METVASDPTIAALLLLGGLRAVIRFGLAPHIIAQARQIVHMVLFAAANQQLGKAQLSVAEFARIRLSADPNSGESGYTAATL